MKQIAILTQPLGHNYGGMLQAWALQRVVRNFGYDVVTIDRQPSQPTVPYLFIRFVYRSILKVFGKRKELVFIELHKKIAYQHTMKFIHSNLKISAPLYNTPQLITHFNKVGYDAVIVGSDQTWRPKYSPCIENFYLDFLKTKNIKKIAYASSFGVSEWEYDDLLTAKCSELANLFDWISVREDSGVELCNNYLNIDVDHVLDPTLLIDRETYEDLIGNERLVKEKVGVYTYILDNTPEKQKIIDEFSENVGQSIFSCQAKMSLENSSNLKDTIMPDPRDWLAGFANAKYVVTDSFHGVVFSIIFQKPFICIANEGRGSSRFSSLFKILGLTTDLSKYSVGITHINGVDKELINRSINLLKYHLSSFTG